MRDFKMMSKTDIERIVDEKLAEMRKQMIEELQGQVESEDRLKTIWDLNARDGEKYYRLYGDGRIYRLSFDSYIDEDIRDIGNAFLTEEEAEFELERKKIETTMRKYSRPFKCSENNYYIEYDHIVKHINIDFLHTYNWGVPYFESEEVAQMAVDEIGRDRLVEYWFRVQDDK